MGEKSGGFAWKNKFHGGKESQKKKCLCKKNMGPVTTAKKNYLRVKDQRVGKKKGNPNLETKTKKQKKACFPMVPGGKVSLVNQLGWWDQKKKKE